MKFKIFTTDSVTGERVIHTAYMHGEAFAKFDALASCGKYSNVEMVIGNQCIKRS
jgi:hypothetical protein